MATLTQSLPATRTWQTDVWSWITTVDHKRIAKLYLFAAVAFFAIAGTESMIMRTQLATPDADAGRRFLGERGFDAGAAAHFGVGYAPRGWSGMLDALGARGFRREELLAAGLVSQGQRGVYDRFRGRLVWPIRDVTG